MGQLRLAHRLVEREAEVDRLAEAVGYVLEEGALRVVVLHAGAGLGKTALLRAACTMAAQRGLKLLHATADQSGRHHPFSVAEELFEPLLGPTQAHRGGGGTALSEESPRDDSPLWSGESYAICRRLWRLSRELAADNPLVLAVDDIHWADEPSLEFLHGLVRHAAMSPLLVVLAASSGDAVADNSSLARLLGDGFIEFLPLRPLSPAGVEHLIRRTWPEATDTACGACHAATGGNPLFLKHVLLEVACGSVGLEDDGLADIGPRSVSEAVRARVAELGEGAMELARAAAVLGDGTRLEAAARLAGMPEARARDLADGLVRASVFRCSLQTEFVHPIVRAAVLSDLGPHARADLHRRAAVLLAQAQAAPLVVARHLLMTDAAGGPIDVDLLHAAAREALARGSAEDAVAFLRRASLEPSEDGDRLRTLVHLARAALRWRPEEAVQPLDDAEALVTSPADRSRIAIGKAEARLALDDVEGAVRLLARAADDARTAGDARLAADAEARLVAAARFDLGTRSAGLGRLGRLGRPAACTTPADAVLLATIALEEGLRGRSIDATLDAATAALGGDHLLDVDDPPPACGLALALAWCDELETADDFLKRLQAAAAGRGADRLLANAACFRSHVALRAGEAEAAVRLARESLETVPPAAWHGRLALPVAFLADALLEHGEAGEANGLLRRHGLDRLVPRFWQDNFLVDVRARLRFAEGDAAGALLDADRCARRTAAWRIENPVVFGLAETKIAALRLLGRPDEADQVLERFGRDVDRWPSLRARALAARLRAMLHPDASTPDLELGVPDTAAVVLERARMLVTVAAAERRSGARSRAREHLVQALDLAEPRGARRIAAWADGELSALGTRRPGAPRRPSGLTTSEWRVVRLALEGMDNRQIARHLFVTVKTVEAHLTRSYRKLGIRSRHELRHLLGTVPGGGPADEIGHRAGSEAGRPSG